MNEINAQFPINCLGYGVCGSYLLNALSKRTRINLFNIGPIEISSQSLVEPVTKALENVKTADFSMPTVKIWHQNQLIEHVGRGRYYGFPIFELNVFNELECLSLSCPDELIVCSNWAKEILENFVNRHIHIVPLGVDNTIFYPSQNTNSATYKFFNIGKWELRKGHDVLIECFNRAFDYDDDVELHLMCHNPFLHTELQHQAHDWEKLCKTSKLASKIILEPRVPHHEDVANFIRSMDCGVFPAKAEGWNLELLESMACGKPVIATNYSAHTEFCRDYNSYLIDIVNTEPANDGIWFHGEGSWAFIGEKQKNQIIDYMRFCYKTRPSNKRGIQTAQYFSWDSSAGKLFNIIN